MIKIFSLFNDQINRPRAFPASFQHVGQLPTQGASNKGKQADKKFGPFWHPGPGWSNLIKIFSLFNTQTIRHMACPASFQHVGQLPTQGASNKGKQADKKFGPFWHPGPGWSNLIKIFSLFNTQTIRHMACPASFQHVGQLPTQGASNKGKTCR